MPSTRHWILIAAALGGCGLAPAEPSGEQAPRLQTYNGITRNGITRNGITRNGLTAAPNGRLNDKSFDSEDPEATLEFLTYLVECALPAGDSASVKINGVRYVLDGAIGLAPEWNDRACETTCQEWITACLLARTNAYGQEVAVSVRGPHAALATSFGERLRYSMQEAAFYGNLFTETPALYACLGSAYDSLGVGDAALSLQRRVCASDDGCGFTVVGPCKDFLFPPYAGGQERACGGEDAVDHYFTSCRVALGTPLFPPETLAYEPVITTFVDPTHPPLWLAEALLGY